MEGEGKGMILIQRSPIKIFQKKENKGAPKKSKLMLYYK